MGTGIASSKQGFFKNDRMFVCSMLVFYSLCTVGLIALLVWGWNSRNQTLSANATATSAVIATQNANATATAVAHATELSQYELIDPFDSNTNKWRVGAENVSYWQGTVQIYYGVYSWDVQDAKDGFVAWALTPIEDPATNYDTYVDIKFDLAPTGKACGGFLFHMSPDGWETGGYTFFICHSGSYSIYYHEGADWDELESQNYSALILRSDWNRLEVLASDSQFKFLINSQLIFETDDQRRTSGSLALFINVDEAETKILFDNFGYQSR
jgi:hypothetical protein